MKDLIIDEYSGTFVDSLITAVLNKAYDLGVDGEIRDAIIYILDTYGVEYKCIDSEDDI